MFMFKKFKISAIISICVALVTILSMAILFLVLNRDVSSTVENKSLDNMMTALEGQSNLIDQRFGKTAEGIRFRRWNNKYYPWAPKPRIHKEGAGIHRTLLFQAGQVGGGICQRLEYSGTGSLQCLRSGHGGEKRRWPPALPWYHDRQSGGIFQWGCLYIPCLTAADT